MSAITRIGDLTRGHAGFHPTRLLEGSPTVFANGRAVGTIGKVYAIHRNGKSAHIGRLSSGSATVFINGRAVGRVNDKLSCGDTVAQGSPTVFAGG